MNPESLACPNCGRVDSVRKVSAIVRDGEVTVAGANGTYTTPSRSAYMLRFPSGDDGPQSGCGPVIGLTAGISMFLPACGSLFFAIPVFLNEYATLEKAILIGMILTFTGVFVIAGVVLIKLTLDSANRTEEQRRLFMANMPKALATWNDMYFCERCDGGFVPAKRLFVPIRAIRQYLYDQNA